MTQTKSDTLALQVGGWGMRLTISFLYNYHIVRKTYDDSLRWIRSNCKRSGTYKEIRIGTWNVLTLYKRGALKNLEKVLQKYKLDITTLQEINFSAQEYPFSYMEGTRWQNDIIN